MNLEDFQPLLVKTSSNASVRSNRSRLSLRNKLSLSTSNIQSQNLSQPLHKAWFEERVIKHIHKNNGRVVNQRLNLPGPALLVDNEPVSSAVPKTSGYIFKENVTEVTRNKQEQVSSVKKNLVWNSKSFFHENDTHFSDNFVFPQKVSSSIFSSPQKTNSLYEQNTEKSLQPAECMPSPCKSRKSKTSTRTSVKLLLKSKGFCPICQVPFSCIAISASDHTEKCCLEPPDGPECPEGKTCQSTKFHHFRDFRHEQLAEERALAGVDSVSEVNLELEEKLLNENNVRSYKRKYLDANYSQSKRSKSPPDDAKENSCSEHSNPFLDQDEIVGQIIENSINAVNEHAFEESNILSLKVSENTNKESAGNPCKSKLDTTHDKPRETDNGVLRETSVPCTSGVCDSNKFGVTLRTSDGEVMVQGIVNSSGWELVQSKGRVTAERCRCLHNLQIQCAVSSRAVSSLTTLDHNELASVSQSAGTSAKALWGPLMRKMRSNSVASESSSSSSDSSSSSRFITTKRKCPYSKLIPGTAFAVDAFSYGDIPGIKYYFLSHFHSDHYVGLNSKWKHAIYCSAITARLVVLQLKVRADLIRILEVDETRNVDRVIITPLDANHCPGSLMLLFQLSDGTNHLHTGDFRATPQMESYSAFWNLDVHTLFLDTTYCNRYYDFPPQEEVVQWAVERVTVCVKQSRSKVLVVCGTYSIGKEKIFLSIAERLGYNIWSSPKKSKLLSELRDPIIQKFMTPNAEEAFIHVLPMSEISLQTLQRHYETFKKNFSEVIAFRPSGWQYSKDNVKMYNLEQRGNISIYSLPYSEHSSFTELQRFVQYLRPKTVVPTVRAKNCSWKEMRTTCRDWLKSSNSSLNKAYSSNKEHTTIDQWTSKK